jgi:uncharacterized protein YerC
MRKSFISFLSAFCLLAGCAMPPQSAGTRSPAAASGASTGVNAPVQNDGDYDAVWVPPPVGSLLGGGYARVPKNNITGNDEPALLHAIRSLNAAAGTQEERPFVVAAVSRSTGVSERELQAQQDVLQLRFGELCAINAIARGNSNKVHEIATLKSKGKTWTQLANANGVSIATVVQTARNASQMTVDSYSNNADRSKGGQRKLKNIGLGDSAGHPPGN